MKEVTANVMADLAIENTALKKDLESVKLERDALLFKMKNYWRDVQLNAELNAALEQFDWFYTNIGKPIYLSSCARVVLEAYRAVRDANNSKPVVQDPDDDHTQCSQYLRSQNKAYPRTCKICGLGKCQYSIALNLSDAVPDGAK